MAKHRKGALVTFQGGGGGGGGYEYRPRPRDNIDLLGIHESKLNLAKICSDVSTNA